MFSAPVGLVNSRLSVVVAVVLVVFVVVWPRAASMPVVDVLRVGICDSVPGPGTAAMVLISVCSCAHVAVALLVLLRACNVSVSLLRVSPLLQFWREMVDGMQFL